MQCALNGTWYLKLILLQNAFDTSHFAKGAGLTILGGFKFGGLPEFVIKSAAER